MLEMFRLAIIFVPLLFGFMLLGSLFVWAQRPDPPPQPNQEFRSLAPQPPRPTPGTQRIREGTPFKGMLVVFRQSGERTALYTVEGNQRYTCHENLALERVLTAIQEKPEREYWRIDGTFAEFRGENFVTIRHAVIATAPAAVAAPVAP